MYEIKILTKVGESYASEIDETIEEYEETVERISEQEVYNAMGRLFFEDYFGKLKLDRETRWAIRQGISKILENLDCADQLFENYQDDITELYEVD